MGQTDALTGLVLRAGPAKKVENPLMVPGIDAAAIVGDFENRKAQLGAAPDRDVAGEPRPEIFERVVDQIGENLLQREAVADDVRQRLDANARFGLGGLVRYGRNNAFNQLAGLDPDRLELAPSL